MGQDRVLRVTTMVVRLGFVIALVLGALRLVSAAPDGVWPVHILGGAMVVLGALVVAFRMASLRVGKLMLMALAVLLGVAGAVVGFAAAGSQLVGLVHLVIMLMVVGLVEMNVARVRRG